MSPIVTNHVDFPKGPEKPFVPWYDPYLADFLHENTIDTERYNFNAYNESYIMCNINTDYTFISLDDDNHYQVSYGLNRIPYKFSETEQSHSLNISTYDANNEIFDWISVQPVYIKEDVFNATLDSPEIINFNASGTVSILVYPKNFSYNYLYVEVDDTVLNDIYSTV